MVAEDGRSTNSGKGYWKCYGCQYLVPKGESYCNGCGHQPPPHVSMVGEGNKARGSGQGKGGGKGSPNAKAQTQRGGKPASVAGAEANTAHLSVHSRLHTPLNLFLADLCLIIWCLCFFYVVFCHATFSILPSHQSLCLWGKDVRLHKYKSIVGKVMKTPERTEDDSAADVKRPDANSNIASRLGEQCHWFKSRGRTKIEGFKNVLQGAP